MDDELLNAQKETKRVTIQKERLLGAMTEMVFLIGKNHVIEYMNRSAVSAFGNKTGQLCYEVFYHNCKPCDHPCPVKLLEKSTGADKRTGLIEARMGNREVELTAVPFSGYRGDELALVVMRDVTRRKKLERELEEFNSNLQKIIEKKVEQLKESERIRNQLVHESDLLRDQLWTMSDMQEMIGHNVAIQELREMIHDVSGSDVTILITGESGTGKELAANLIHKNSTRKDKIFLKFNCAAVSESLLESDLFGSEKGAFTGANARRKGKFEFADGGTIFLDEIGEITPRMQVALLRLLQNGEMQRVGSSETIKVDVRVIASTNANLAQRVKKGAFREDLYYRLNIITLHLPPLRDRKDDIVALASHFIRKYRADFRKDIDFLPSEVINKLLMYNWPGNIRELENVIQRALIFTKGNFLTLDDIIFASPPSQLMVQGIFPSEEQLINKPLKNSVADFEKMVIAATLKANDNSVHETADILGIGKTALYARIKRYNLL